MKYITKKAWFVIKISILLVLIILTGFVVWASTLTLPTLDNFEERRVLQSTKIYDRTGEVVLFDFNEDVRRTVIDLEDMSTNIMNATIAIEDDKFYSHFGVRPLSFVRAALENLRTQSFSQGGSTITQQVVKNSLLTVDKTITRKIKEWILAIRLEQRMDKDEILELYLNEIPYGGTIYGIEEAARSYFDTSAAELTIAESAYLAALPQAPTFYSPYGDNFNNLKARQETVLRRMRSLGFINEQEYQEALLEEVEFIPRYAQGIRAPHFVFYVREILEQELGTEALERGGLKVITTLDYEIQQEAEDLVRRYAERNSEQFDAENAAAVMIDPKTGQILTMVGSRDFFDEELGGQFNTATALRQPGSTFKPFVYAAAFEKGYTPETVVFDVPTQFNVNCPATQFNNNDGCYAPINYDDVFVGPISFRDALAQSRNIPAVKAFYLAGLEDSAQTARQLGISTLDNVNRYGLTLVLGGGEVKLVDMTSAYGGFANDGRVHPHTPILEVVDNTGETLLEYQDNQDQRVLDQNVARMINDVLSDNVARTPGFGANSLLYFPNNDVAVKTGTTNEYVDAWTVGYTPEISVGVWAGNNDATPMVRRTAGFIITPLWHELMQIAIDKGYGDESFTLPTLDYDGLKPILRGEWNTGGAVNSILALVDRSDPRGPVPSNPDHDPQFNNWQTSVRNWFAGSGLGEGIFGSFDPDSRLDIRVDGLYSTYRIDDNLSFEVTSDEGEIRSVVVFLNQDLLTAAESGLVNVSLSSANIEEENSYQLIIIATDYNGQAGEYQTTIRID